MHQFVFFFFMLEVDEVEPLTQIQFAQTIMLRELPEFQTFLEMDGVLDAASAPSAH